MRISDWSSDVCSSDLSAEPASDHQLTFARSYAAAAHHASALDDLEALLDGSLTFDGLAVDQDLRWVLIGALARAGRFDEEQIAAELARDNTIPGQENAADRKSVV